LNLAHQRAPVVRAIRQINRSLPLDDYDRRLLTVWKEELLAGCLDIEKFRPRYEQAVERRALLPQLEQAVEAEDTAAVARIMQAPVLTGYPMELELAEKIDELQNRAVLAQQQQRHALMQSLMDNERAAFARQFDINLVQTIAAGHTHHQATITRWMEEEILPPAKCGLAPDAGNAVSMSAENRCQLRWNWPAASVTDTCLIVVTQTAKVAPHAIPADLDAVHHAELARSQYEAAGCYEFEIDPAWHGATVVVWAYADAGYQDFYTSPVVLGAIDATPKKARRWGIF